MRVNTMEELLIEAIENRNEYNSAKLFLAVTKKIIKCSNISKGQMIFYVFDEKLKIYKNTPAMIITHLVREELISFLTGKIKEVRDGKLMTKFGMLVSCLGRNPFCCNLVSILAPMVYDEEFKKRLDSCRDTFNFRNGLVDLRTGKFRERTADDFVSKTLDYDYKKEKNEEKIKEVVEIFSSIFNNDADCLDTGFRFYGYCLTGHTKAEKMLFIVGPSAQNGKTTQLVIFENCFPIYCKKISSKVFNENYEKAHKTFVELGNCRLCFIEELKKTNLDVDCLKDFITGKKLGGVEVMYGTTTDIIPHCKTVITSNFYPTFLQMKEFKEEYCCFF